MRQRHALYLSEAMTRQLQVTAAAHHLSKSQVLEAALERYLSPTNNPPASEGQNLHQKSNTRSLRRLERDLAITSELLATFIRYFLMVTPPLPEAEHAAARALGQLRLDAVIQDVARRLRTDRSLKARVTAIIGVLSPQTSTGTSKQVTDDESSADRSTSTDTSTDDGEA